MRPEVTVKENRDFRRIYRKGRSAVSPCMVVYCQKNKQGRSRLGVTVSTKLGHAVVRNRVRRRLREIYRLNLDRTERGYDVIVVARVRAAHTAYRRLEQEYLAALKRMGILREETV